jgi:serine/threonine kinase PknH
VDGTPFGRYRLVELIGQGGMGEVWRAHDTDTDRIVAIKLLPAHFSKNEDFQRRFRREAHAAARLDSPHVIPIHNYGEIDGRLYVDMRLIKGRDLQTVLADGPLEPSRAVRIIEQIAIALHAAHEVGLMHRDVKPSNILLDKNDFAYLIDFGIARAADETRLTKTGNTIGTFHYIAPERLSGELGEDARADIYALACVLYECLTGRTPFAGDDMARLVAAHLNTPPPQPSTAKPDLPPQLDQVIATGMAKDPDQRYATTVELADAARDAITVPIPAPTPSPAPEPPTVPASAPTAPPTIPAEDQTPSPTRPPTEPAPLPTAPSTLAAQYRTPSPGNDSAWAPTTQRPPVEVPTKRPEPSAEQLPPPTPPSKPLPDQPLFQRLSRRGKIALIVGPIAVAAIAATTVAIVTSQNATHQTSSSSYPQITGETPTSTSASVAPVQEPQLDGLLLDAATISTAMHTSGMTVFETLQSMWTGGEALVKDKNCLAVAYPAEFEVYSGTGWTAARGQVLRSPGSSVTQEARQVVVAFSSADAAAAFYAASSRSWSACSNRRYDDISVERSIAWSTGPLSDQNGWLTIQATDVDQPTWTAQRALTVRNNVVIDVSAYSFSPSSQLATAIAEQIAAKVPG